MATAKVQSSTTNHANIKSFVTATLIKCATGSATVTLGSTVRDCSQNTRSWAGYFITYFNSINKNPYSGYTAITPSGGPRIGQTGIGSTNNHIAIRTNVGTESGRSAFLPASGWDYIIKE